MKLSALHYTGLAFLSGIVLFTLAKLPDYLFGEKSKKYCNKKHHDFKDDFHNSTLYEDNQYDYMNSSHFDDNLIPFDEALHREEISEGLNVDFNRKLVRKRRFLIFPEGSSLQLVFCLTYFGIIPIGDLFYMGATASLAWELPQDPYSSFNHHGDALHRKDKGPVVYKDFKGSQKIYKQGNQILVNRLTGNPIQPSAKNYYYKNYQSSYKRNNRNKITTSTKQRHVIKPVFAKRSISNDNKVGNAGEKKKRKRKKRVTIEPGDKEEMHRKQGERKYLKSKHMDEDSLVYHKSSRYKLYGKLEKLFIGTGNNGKECVLKALCEMGQNLHGKQGTFMEEIIRVIFTLPKSSRYHAKYLHYDQAHVAKYKCEDIYPKCTLSVKNELS